MTVAEQLAEALAKLKVAPAVEPKPKVRTDEDSFGQDDEAEKVFLPVDMQYLPDGRLAIIFPAEIPYSLTRDTTSRSRRSVVCRLSDPDGVPGVLVGSNGKQLPVTFNLSSTLNISASAVKVGR
jgi:hypothetical protein